MSPLIFVTAQERRTPNVPEIPGITAQDKLPNGCVTCHRNHPERKMDHRLSTTLAKWNKEVAPERLKMAQAAAPHEIKLKGHHPDVSTKIEIIPDDCFKCHKKGSETFLHLGT